MERFKVIKYYDTGKKKTVFTTPYEAEARRYCGREDTKGVTSRGVKWLCGWVKVNNKGR